MTTETEGQEALEDTTAATIAEEGSQPAEAGTEAEGQSGDDAAATAESQRQERKQTAQDRIDEVTRARREAERERDYWRDEALRQQQAAPKPDAAAKPADGAPEPSAYESGEYDPAFIRDLARYETRQEVQQQQAQARLQAAIQTFDSRTAQQYPDGEPAGIVALRRQPVLPPAMTEIILASENGPKIAAHLGDNLGEFQRLSALAPHMQAYEIAKLEAKLTQPASQPAKTVTSAPEPAPQARGGGGQFKVSPDTGDFAAFDKAY